MNRQPGLLPNFEFSKEAIARAVRLGRLLTLEIEFSLRCNFKCPYCYVVQDGDLKDELSPREIQEAILQAKSLGAGRIIVLGGEPSIYPHILDMLRFMRAHDLEVEMFTNGSGITPEFAGQLSDLNVRVVLKMNSFNEALQDRLSGRPGAFRIIQAAFAHLKGAGYLFNDRFLAVSSVICRQNMPELPRMWRWLREQNIEPYFEIITPQANACLNDWLYVKPFELERFFQEIAALDRRLFGRFWEIQPPLVGNRCMRHQFSCLVTAKGEVRPCVGITLSLGNIRRQPLEKILAGSRVLTDLKDYRRTIKGPCRNCDRAAGCYGCRGAAFQLTGDYLASDPLCWRNACLEHPQPLRPHSGPGEGLAGSLSDDR